MNQGKRIYEKLWKIMKNNKNDVSQKLLHGIHDSTDHCVHNNFNFSFVFMISLFLLEFMNKFHDCR